MAAQGEFDSKWEPILEGLVAKSPPGQVSNVAGLCRQLAGAPVPDDLIGRLCAEHNEQHLRVVRLPSPASGSGIVVDVARKGRRNVKTTKYVDPRSGTEFVVDQESGECTQATAGQADARAAAAFRCELQAALDAYLRGHFPDAGGVHAGCSGQAAVSVFEGDSTAGGDGKVELRVVLSCQRERPQGRWVGSWISQWRIVFTPGQPASGAMTGVVELRTHYAEDCNVHARHKEVRKAKIKETVDPAKFAQEVRDTLQDMEDEHHGAVEDFSANAGGLKSLRRVLPLTKERFDWRPLRLKLMRDMRENAEHPAEN